MKRFLPRRLAGQMALLLGLALLIAQLANFALILNERQKLSLARNEGPSITRFAGVAADLFPAPPEFHAPILSDNSHRGARFAMASSSGIADTERNTDLEGELTDALIDARIAPLAVRAAKGPGPNPTPDYWGKGGPRADALSPSDAEILRLAVQGPDRQWLTARMRTPPREPWLSTRLAIATFLLYVIVLGASAWIAARIARPLRDLTQAAERFQGRADPIVVEPRGPDDVRLAIDAFNAMNRRVVSLIDEKDHMLGAIGHDLRTPLASLRIRLENMEPEEEREAAIAKITEMTAMLEDILVLARSGRAREEARRMDVTALVEAIGDDFQERGLPVIIAPSDRHVLAVQPTLLRRALCNLIDNAIAYGGSAAIAVERVADGIEIKVSDNGPGIPDRDLRRVLEPFQRVEGSRNRATGGSGLGLAIAQSIAESHGGHLYLSAHRPTGLVATIFLPG
jgi:signal transduction histidine kinase